jgi:hypothetical protein
VAILPQLFRSLRWLLIRRLLLEIRLCGVLVSL